MKFQSILLGMVGLTMAVSAAMAEPPPVTDTMSARVDRLEKMMNAQSNYQVQTSLQEMRDELQSLRGMLEVQQFELDKLKDQQQQLMRNAASAPAASNVAVAPPGKMNMTPVPGAVSDAETKQYEAAYVLLTEQKYSSAIPALESYIQSYPNGQYTASAYYWLGETQTIANDLDEAKRAFQTVIDKYPTSPKVVDASLKLAMVYEDAGQYDKALALFQDVKTKYPNTPQAKLASERIQQISNIDR
ncbi:MAG: tol-pal system protein YbgF [Gammaproteobacteria bacterium]